MIVPYLLNVNLPKIADPFPYQETVSQLENSIQTYINYHKTHAMATCYSGMGDGNPETQDIDNDSPDNFQEENIIQQLIHEMEQLRQTIEDKDNDPRDVIHQLGTKAKSVNTHTAPSFRTH